MSLIISKIITGIDAAALKTIRQLLGVASQNSTGPATDRLDFLTTSQPDTFISIRSKTVRIEKNLLGINLLARKEDTSGTTTRLATGSFTFLFFQNLEPDLFNQPPANNLMIFSDN